MLVFLIFPKGRKFLRRHPIITVLLTLKTIGGIGNVVENLYLKWSK